jgi:hypothetical protein
MACSRGGGSSGLSGGGSSSRLPFLIVSHEAVVVRAEEWLTMNHEATKSGDAFDCSSNKFGAAAESSSSVVAPLVRSGSSPSTVKLLDVDMLAQETLSLHAALKLDGPCCDRAFLSLSLSPYFSLLPTMSFVCRGLFLLLSSCCSLGCMGSVRG